MASTSSALTISSSSTLVDGKAPRQSSAASPQGVSLPPPPVHSQNVQGRPLFIVSHSQNIAHFTHLLTEHMPGRKIAHNVMALATSTGEASPAEEPSSEVPEIVKALQETWDKVDDKYAVSLLALAGVIAL